MKCVANFHFLQASPFADDIRIYFEKEKGALICTDIDVH